MHLDISKNLDELSLKVADWLINYILDTLKKQDRFTIALSGGSTPKKLYQLLSSAKYKNKPYWRQLHFFWGDERFVPIDDERNNAGMAMQTLLNHVPVLFSQVHPIQTDTEPQAAATDYEKLLHEYFDNSLNSFDLVLLGLGDDGHTLSLFPGYSEVYEKKNWVKAFFLKEQAMHRITLTPPIVNKSSRIAFLVSGTGKASILKRVLHGDFDAGVYPAQIIQPYNGELYWFADEAAAREMIDDSG